ncbi:MAG: PQQ-dependent sugar dehydrogenase, partial [Anaerolineales bacterium]|nr:PQQ-dependent sugar dehydrogenase [Anaerolineales bacterium]
TTDKGQPYLDYFELPGNERYYDFTWGPVHFFAVSSDSREPDGVGRSSLQAQWLQERLARSNTPWQVVYFHQPAYSSGATYGSIDWMQWPFAEWGADLVLAGHEHLYERLTVNGIPHITVGLSGYPGLYAFGEPLEGSQVRYREDYGALLVEADPTELRLRLENTAGQVIDSYSLQHTPATPAAPDNATSFPDPQAFAWTLFAQGFEKPLGLEHPGDGSGRLFVLEQPGQIRILQDGQVLPEPFLDIRTRVGDQGNEQGLLGLAFHPQYASNGYFYLNYTDNDGDTVIARFSVSADPNRADAGSEYQLMNVSQPYSNHNGGHLTFGPDGYLYIGLGDGGSAGDPQGNAQDLNTLLGKLLRIDVDRASPYGAPASNPFIGQGRSEIWAWGLRNPWRFGFDAATGDLYIADVGQNQWEEIHFLAAGTPGGANFGWDYYEASHAFEGSPPAEQAFVMPVWEYDHSQGCSVSGGLVYRGRMPEWQGIYLYGDFCSGKVWGLLRDAQGNWQNQLLFESGANITAFGEGPQGEVYLVDRSGRILLLERAAE